MQAHRKIPSLFSAVIAGLFLSGAHAAQLPDSVWSGTLEVSTVTAEGKILRGPSDLLLDSCNGNVRMWEKVESKITPLPIAKHVESLESAHLFSFSSAEDTQPGFEEMNTLTAIQISDEKMWVLWTRLVNNRDLPADDPNRYFHNIGAGVINRHNTSCLTFLPVGDERRRPLRPE